MRHKRFEIVYADESVVAGVTRKDFEDAPAAAILFVIILYSDGHIEKHKGLDLYKYQGASKRGAVIIAWPGRPLANPSIQLTELRSWMTCQKQANTPITKTKMMKALKIGFARKTPDTRG